MKPCDSWKLYIQLVQKMVCFSRLHVHINPLCWSQSLLLFQLFVISDTLSSLQFAYQKNHSTEDAVNAAIHTAFSHLKYKDTYVWMLFIDYRSAFNTVILNRLMGHINFFLVFSSQIIWITKGASWMISIFPWTLPEKTRRSLNICCKNLIIKTTYEIIFKSTTVSPDVTTLISSASFVG